jgi:hypothetical protein
MDSKKYIGMDVHQATISVAVRDSAGKLVMESVIETKATTILEFLRGLRGSLWVKSSSNSGAASHPRQIVARRITVTFDRRQRSLRAFYHR